jgi:hypothetical protein
VLEEEGLLVDDFSGVVELIEDEAVGTADVQQLCVFIVAAVYCAADHHDEIPISYFQCAEALAIGLSLDFLRIPFAENSLPEASQFRLFRREVLQRFLFFEADDECGGIVKHSLPDLEDILDDLDAVAGLQPKVLVGAVHHELVGEGGQRDLADAINGDGLLDVSAIHEVEGETADGEGLLVALVGSSQRVDAEHIDDYLSFLEFARQLL